MHLMLDFEILIESHALDIRTMYLVESLPMCKAPN
jgi:hypothetical protein